MADIKQALPFVLQNEGGAAYTDNPHDNGGPTRWGVTLKTLTIFRHHPCSAEDVKNLTENEACQIYKINYWDALRLDGVENQNVATAIFDVGVNRGVGTARLYVADICSHMGRDKINDCDPKEFIKSFAERVKQGYLNIVANHPHQRIFIKGWLNRADRLLTLI